MHWMYYVWASLLIVANAVALAATLIGLPGNWMMAAGAVLFAFLFHDAPTSISWTTVGIVVTFAVVGELLELVAGVAGAAKQGASRCALALSLAGTMMGSIAGAFVAVPIPIVGPVIGVLGGGALGAFAGAWLGESWRGRSAGQRLNVGVAAMTGRILGTVGKLSIGAMMFTIIAVDIFL